MEELREVGGAGLAYLTRQGYGTVIYLDTLQLDSVGRAERRPTWIPRVQVRRGGGCHRCPHTPHSAILYCAASGSLLFPPLASLPRPKDIHALCKAPEISHGGPAILIILTSITNCSQDTEDLLT